MLIRGEVATIEAQLVEAPPQEEAELDDDFVDEVREDEHEDVEVEVCIPCWVEGKSGGVDVDASAVCSVSGNASCDPSATTAAERSAGRCRQPYPAQQPDCDHER